MNLPRFSVHRPVFTTMAMFIVLILGVVSLWRLPIDLLPEIELPSLTISTRGDAESPEQMERQVTEVIEGAVAAVAGVEQIVSSSATGVSNVTVRFSWGTNLDAAANDVRDRLDRIIRNLPDEVERPQVRRFDPSNFPIVILGVSSALDPVDMTRLIDEQVRYRLERIAGVAVVDTWGRFEREIQVNFHPERLTALDLPLEPIIEAIRAANIDLSAGQLEQAGRELTLRIPGEVTDLDTLRDVPVAHREGTSIRLWQVADVEDTHRRLTRLVRLDGQRALRLAVRRQSGANTVAVAGDVLAEVERINADLPQLGIVPVINSAEYIERSIDNVTRSILYGGSLALLVLLVFLRNFRSTVVIMLTVPVSIIATFMLIYFGGFTLNLMTLGGLALGLGIMVDSAIVVLENIYRHRNEHGTEPMEASVRGTTEVIWAILAATLTNLAIFMPLIFIQGTAGVLFRQLALVIAFALACSLVVAVSVVPMLAARLVPSQQEMAQRQPRWMRAVVVRITAALQTLDEAYRALVGRVLGAPWRTVFTAAVLLGSALLLTPRIGTEYMPATDEGEVRINAEMDVGTDLHTVDRQMRRIEQIVTDAVPERRAMVSSVGPSTWRPSAAATGSIRLSLPPIAHRQRSSAEVAADLRDRLVNQVPGTTVRVREAQGMFLLNRLLDSDEGLAVEIRGFDLHVLDALGVEVRRAVENVDGVTDVRLSRESGAPELRIEPDRDRAADLQVTELQIARFLETAIAGSSAGDFREGGEAFRILLRLDEAERRSLDEILDLTLTNRAGEAVLLRNVVRIEEGTGPVLIDRQDQQRIVSVLVNIAGRDLGSVARDIEQRLRQIPRPTGYEMTVAGDYEQQQEAFAELVVTLVLSLVLVYMVMACLYESLRDPLVVMFSVPVAGIGVVAALLLTGSTFNVQSFIGCIMLGGIVINNAILIVDQAGRLRREGGLDVAAAVTEAGRRRLRPILMTSLTTILALLPLALGMGEGAEAQAPLARVVIGGLLVSMLLTLVLIPAVYRIFHPEPRYPA